LHSRQLVINLLNSQHCAFEISKSEVEVVPEFGGDTTVFVGLIAVSVAGEVFVNGLISHFTQSSFLYKFVQQGCFAALQIRQPIDILVKQHWGLKLFVGDVFVVVVGVILVLVVVVVVPVEVIAEFKYFPALKSKFSHFRQSLRLKSAEQQKYPKLLHAKHSVVTAAVQHLGYVIVLVLVMVVVVTVGVIAEFKYFPVLKSKFSHFMQSVRLKSAEQQKNPKKLHAKQLVVTTAVQHLGFVIVLVLVVAICKILSVEGLVSAF
jgi:hypothetical protein